MFYATIPKGWYEVVGKWLTMKGYGREKKEEFWRNNPIVISWKMFIREPAYLFLFTKDVLSR